MKGVRQVITNRMAAPVIVPHFDISQVEIAACNRRNFQVNLCELPLA